MPKQDSGRSKKTEEKDESEDDTNVYEMEDILEFKKEGNQTKWKVKWRGYSVDQCTWEPQDNILNPGKEIYDKMTKLKKEWEVAQNSKKKTKKADSSPTVAKKRAKLEENNNEEASSKEEVVNKKRRSRSVTAIPRADDSEISPVSATQEAEKEAEEEQKSEHDVESEEIKADENEDASPPEVVETVKGDKCDPATQTRPENLSASDISENNTVAEGARLAEDTQSVSASKKRTGTPAVSHMRDVHGEQQVCIEWSGGDHEWTSIAVARELYNNELLDYLLSRVRFRPLGGRKQ